MRVRILVMERIGSSLIIILFILFSLVASSHSRGIISMTPVDVGENFIKVIKTTNSQGSINEKNIIKMYMENDKIILSKGQNFSIHQNNFVLVDGDCIDNIGKKPIKVVNSDGSAIFVGPGEKNRVENGQLLIIKWYEFWK